MSHLPERKEKVCLNCKSVIYGRFCHLCGQENVEPKETLWHLTTHFVYDITHFDGKFFSTLKYLLLKPGYLSYEYIRGRRAAYLNPIKMYIFTSAFFFIIFFSFVAPGINQVDDDEVSRRELLEQRKVLIDRIASAKDSAVKDSYKTELVKVNKAIRFLDQNGLLKFSFGDEDEDTAVIKQKVLNFGDSDPPTIREYDSIQNSLPPEKRHGWLKRSFKTRVIAINEKYAGNEKLFWKNVEEKFLHSIPQMMFVSLPLVALMFQLLYVRKRKQYFYVSHAIFAIHVYIALYILILIGYAFEAFDDATGWGIFSFLTTAIIFVMFFYLYKAMRNFYQQRRAKTIFKYLAVLVLFFILMTVLMVVYALTSAFTI